ncbi:hypothetical protein, partial [Bacillus mycoides]|uniref:hypothetical protein n=1 Tax=Bacillus mycoides TaxID=1405 RepID=UPI003A808532
LEDITYPCYLFLDQSTRTGYALFDNDSRLVLSGVVEKGATEAVRTYGFQLADMVRDLAQKYKVSTVFHEEVYDKENMITTETLMYIKHKIQDISYTDKEIEVLGLDHMKWKSELAKPEKFVRSKDHKEQVQKFVSMVFPLVTMFTDDESDAIGMGIAVLMKQRKRGNFFDVTRYNKNLSLWEFIIEGEVTPENVHEVIGGMRKPVRDAFELGGAFEIPLDSRKRVDDTFRKFLSHRDSVVYTQIPKTYKYWGVMLLDKGVKPSKLEREDQSFTFISCRRKRL